MYYLMNYHEGGCVFEETLSLSVEYIDLPNKKMKMSCIGEAPRDLYFLSLQDQDYIFNNYESINRIVITIDQEHI